MGLSADEYAFMDGVALADLVATRQITPREALGAAMARADVVNPPINAIVSRFDALAEELADAVRPGSSALAGVPTLLKDIGGGMAGVVTRAASGFVPPVPGATDSGLVCKLKAAGVVPFGKTNASEFGLTPLCESVLHGPARNPFDLARSTGGSSGGAAAAVAAGIVPVAHATDGGGSIRIPASCCGVVGLKPSRGRVTAAPEGDWSSGITVQGMIARSVRDAAAALDAVSGYLPGDPYVTLDHGRGFLAALDQPIGRPLRIAVDTGPYRGHEVDEECRAAVLEAARACEELGHQVSFARPAMLDQMATEDVGEAFHTIYGASLAASIDAIAAMGAGPPSAERMEAMTWNYYRRGRARTAADYAMALFQLQYATRAFAAFFVEHDVWLTPVTATVAPPLGLIDTTAPDAMVDGPAMTAFNPLTPIYNMSGQPAVSLPLAETATGVPIGVMAGGALGAETLLLRLARQLEEARPWAARRPVGMTMA